jgi:hypothetical protein
LYRFTRIHVSPRPSRGSLSRVSRSPLGLLLRRFVDRFLEEDDPQRQLIA